MLTVPAEGVRVGTRFFPILVLYNDTDSLNSLVQALNSHYNDIDITAII